MVVRDWMRTGVETVRPDDDVKTAEEALRRRHIRHLPVLAAGRLIGIVSDRDVRGADPAALVESVMTPMPVTATPAMPIEQAAARCCDRKIGALPVVEDDRLVGIVTESDLLAALVELCAIFEPTTVLEIECEGDGETAQRARRLLERRGGRVSWMTAVGVHGDRQRITIRVRMPIGRTPEKILEEAGFPVQACVVVGTHGRPGGGSGPVPLRSVAPRAGA